MDDYYVCIQVDVCHVDGFGFRIVEHDDGLFGLDPLVINENNTALEVKRTMDLYENIPIEMIPSLIKGLQTIYDNSQYKT